MKEQTKGCGSLVETTQNRVVSLSRWIMCGGLFGALAMTAGMFLPAFAFTLVGHELMEQVVERPSVHAALDGVAAGVVGLIAATALQLLLATVTDLPRAAIFLAALVVAYGWKAKWSVLMIVASAGLLGLLLLR